MENEPREKPVCRECGSDSVVADAAARWDDEKQEFFITSIFDKGWYCDNCDDTVKIDWVSSDKEVKDEES